MNESVETTSTPIAPTEVPAVAAPAAPEDPKPGARSAEFSALARKEKTLQRQREQIKAEQSKMAEREAKLQAFETASDPISVLRAKGFTYQEATDFILNDGKPTPESELKSIKQQIEEIKLARDQEKKDAEKSGHEQSQKAYDDALAAFKEDVTAFVVANPDDYEMIALYESQALVVDTVTEHWRVEFEKWQANPDGPKPKAMSMKEAADLVERYHDTENEKLLKTKRWAAKLKPVDPDAPVAHRSAPTLAHALTQSSTPSLLPAKTENERMARALAALAK